MNSLANTWVLNNFLKYVLRYLSNKSDREYFVNNLADTKVLNYLVKCVLKYLSNESDEACVIDSVEDAEALKADTNNKKSITIFHHFSILLNY